jgi:hypothetical protein
MGDILKNWNNQILIFRLLMHGLKNLNVHPETEGFILAIQDRVINTRNYKKHIRGLKLLNISFLLAQFWLKANIRNVIIYSLKLYT